MDKRELAFEIAVLGVSFILCLALLAWKYFDRQTHQPSSVLVWHLGGEERLLPPVQPVKFGKEIKCPNSGQCLSSVREKGNE